MSEEEQSRTHSVDSVNVEQVIESKTTKNAENSKLDPKTIVLAKVKGYPPWPAMILDETILPDYILKKKPKNVKQPAKKKKTSKPVVIYPVRFFSDDTYIWIKDSDLKILNHDMIQKHLGNERRRKDKLLDVAYNLALDPPDMELFVKYGSKAAPDDPPPEEDSDSKEYVADEDEEEELEDEDLEDIEDDVDVDEDLDDEEDYGAPPRKKKALAKKPAKKASNGSTKSRSKAKPKAEGKKAPPEIIPEEAIDSDWGLDEWSYNFDEGNYIFDDRKEQRDFVESFPKAADVQSRYNKYVASFQKVSSVLISYLLSETPDVAATLDALRTLEGILDIPKSIFLKSTLLKVLIITVRKPIEKFPYPKIKNKAAAILHSLLDLSVASTSIDDLNKWEEELRKKEKESQAAETESKDDTPKPAVSNGSTPPVSV